MKAQITASGRFINHKKVGPTDDKPPSAITPLIKLVCWLILILLTLWAFAAPQVRSASALPTPCYETGC